MKPRSSLLLFLLPLLGTCLVPRVANAQFVEPLSSADLSQSQSRAIEQLQQLGTTASELNIVKINPEALRDASVVVPLPDRSGVRMEAITREENSAGNFSAVGRVVSDAAQPPESQLPEGSTTMVVNGNSVTGSIHADDGLYRIRSLGGGAHAIFKADNFPQEEPPSIMNRTEDEAQERDLPVLPEEDHADVQEITITVLVAYTQAVADNVSDVEGLVDLAFDETNSSYKKSGVHIKLDPASTPLKVDYRESGSHEDDLKALESKSDGNMDEVHRERDRTKADVVVLWSDEGAFCGLASQILARADTAFAVVYWDCATGNLSFPHEIGHLQGARHNPEADPTDIPLRYAHGFIDPPKKRRTIMGYPCPDVRCTRMPMWAFPTDWGTSERNHDARVLNMTRRWVASFR